MDTPDFAGVPVLVTGGAGFIGSHLVDALLAAGATVRVLDNFATGRRENLAHCLDAIDLVEADLREADACRKAVAGCRIVFHQAALGSVPRSIEDPATSLAVNVQGTAHVFDAARREGVERVVYASSSSVYGDSDELPKIEGHEGRPLSPYATSKVMTEELAEVFGGTYRLHAVGLRYFNVYGPRQDPEGAYAAVIPRFCAACLAGEAPLVHGDGRQSRDFTFIDDAVLANLLAVAAEVPAGSFNVAAGARTEVLDVALRICRLAELPKQPAFGPPRPGDVPHSLADLGRVRQALGFQPRWSLADGLARTFEWYREQRAGS